MDKNHKMSLLTPCPRVSRILIGLPWEWEDLIYNFSLGGRETFVFLLINKRNRTRRRSRRRSKGRRSSSRRSTN